MSQDTAYKPIPLVYKSRGLIARDVTDQVPVGYFLDFLNLYEREENSVSSRYGTRIITRDPDSTSHGVNYFFAQAPTSLAKLNFNNQAYRYAGLADGTLWRRSSNTQGPYTQLTLPAGVALSGLPFGSVVSNCFQTSQPFLFVYDADTSIKDFGTGQPVLTGLDPQPNTANTLPYSPLLTLIDNFASTNSYTSSGFSVPWAFATVTTLAAASSQEVTDFPEFFGITNPGGGGYTMTSADLGQPTTAEVLGSIGTDTEQSPTILGFPSVSISSADTVTLTTTLDASIFITDRIGAAGDGTVVYQYSPDGGTTWFGYFTFENSATDSISGKVITTPITGITNLDQIALRIIVTATLTAAEIGFVQCQVSGQIDSASATVDSSNSDDPFGGVQDGMLAVIGAADPPPIAVASAQGQTLVAGLYTELLITTVTAHSLVAGNYCALYGSSSDLLDGFYQVLRTPTANSVVVAYVNAVLLNGSGGILTGGLTVPSTCVIANHYSTPYPTQFSGWGFYQQVPLTQTSFPIGCWGGTIAQNTTSASPALVGKTVALDLSYNNQVTDDDLIILTLLVSNPAAIDNIRLQFDVRGSGYTSSYYYKDISAAYYQAGVQNLQSAYTTAEQQIFGNSLGLLSGAAPNSTVAQLQPGNFSTGPNAWVTVYLRRGDFVPVGNANTPGVDWSAITGWQLVITTNTVGSSSVSVNGLYLQWGYGPSSFGGVGYDYRYTPYNAATGTEGNGSPSQAYNSQFGWLASLNAPIVLRQANQVTGQYFSDPQDTHVRIYRRGGTFSDTWRQIDQIPNITAGGQFAYKDVIPDANIAQAFPLVLDNDPPVTSSLRVPIQTALAAATVSPGSSIYSLFAPQTVTVQQASAVFVPGQVVDVGNPANLEQVRVAVGGTGTFSAVFRLQHNAGEQVNVYAVPRQPCNLAALAYGQVWLGGDANNPHYLYFSKVGQPESFGPQNYIPVGSPKYPITIVVNWRGTLFVATTQTWWLIVGGAQPYAQPTGSIHGAVANVGWCQTESAIVYRSTDGWRQFAGADGAYMTLPIEFVFRQNPDTPVPLADPSQAVNDVFAFYNNTIFGSYVSLNSGVRYRLAFDTNYQRFRYDDRAATAMLWEQDTNKLLLGVPAPPAFPGLYAIVEDFVTTQDYDDGGWQGSPSALVQTPIQLSLQPPFQDIGAPHFPKQWNVLETDVNTQGQ